jgi:hypothetical protein
MYEKEKIYQKNEGRIKNGFSQKPLHDCGVPQQWIEN